MYSSGSVEERVSVKLSVTVVVQVGVLRVLMRSVC
jgi:hypothetical protein